MKKTLTTLLAFLLVSTLWAQSYVQAGDGKENTSLPSYTSWKYSYSSMLYTAQELGGAKKITALAFFNNGDDLTQLNADFDVTNQTVWMKHTSDQSFKANASYQYDYEAPTSAASGYTKVFEGSYHFGAPGWVIINLSTPFEYNGNDNIIIHWENGYGKETYSVKFAGTIMGANCMAKCWGSDYSIPQTPGYQAYDNIRTNCKFYYESDPETPGTPELLAPAPGKIKIDLNDSLKFAIGKNTLKYDVFVGNTEQSLEKVASDIAVSAEGTFTYVSPEGLWKANTKYFWKVVAKNDSKEVASGVSSFKTQELIASFPWNEGFEKYWLTNYDPDNIDTLSSVINTNYPDSTPWTFTNDWSATIGINTFKGLFSAKCSAWNPSEQILVSPRINLPSGQRISFWWRNNIFFKDAQATRELVTTYFEASVDGGKTWDVVEKLTPTELMKEYVQVISDLSDYAGNNTYLRWRFVENTENNFQYFWLDDITIEAVPSGGQLAFNTKQYEFVTPLCVGGKSTFPLVVSNTGTADAVIAGIQAQGPFSSDYTGVIKPGKADTILISFAPTEAGNYNVAFNITSNGSTGDKTIQLKASSLNPLASFFESFDVKKDIPDGWNAIQSSMASQWVQNIWMVNYTSDVYSAPYACKMNRINNTDTIDPVILVSPGVTGFDVNALTFWAKKGSSEYDLEIEVGVLSDPANPADFETQKVIALTPDFTKYEVKFKPSNKKPYIGFKYGKYAPVQPFPYASLRIDDISWETVTTEAPLCPLISFPENNAADVDIFKDFYLKWAAASSNVDGYKIYFGTTEAANEIVNGIDVKVAFKYLVEQELDFDTRYYFKVTAYNQYGESNGCSVNSFTTMANPTISSYPYIQNFDNTLNVAYQFDYPLGWSVENTDGDGICWDMITIPPAMPGLTHNSSKGAIHVPLDLFSAKDDWMFTPPLMVKKGKKYTAEFFIYTIMDLATGKVYNEELSIWTGNDRFSKEMTDSILYTNINSDKEWKKIKAEFTAKEDGIKYIGFHCISAAEQYILLFDDLTLTESDGSGVQDNNAMFSLYPNPANDEVTINLPTEKDCQIEIINIAGKVVERSICTSSVYRINVSDWTKGFYTVTVSAGNERKSVKLLIK